MADPAPNVTVQYFRRTPGGNGVDVDLGGRVDYAVVRVIGLDRAIRLEMPAEREVLDLMIAGFALAYERGAIDCSDRVRRALFPVGDEAARDVR